MLWEPTCRETTPHFPEAGRTPAGPPSPATRGDETGSGNTGRGLSQAQTFGNPRLTWTAPHTAEHTCPVFAMKDVRSTAEELPRAAGVLIDLLCFLKI